MPVDPAPLHGMTWLRDPGPSMGPRVLNIVGFAFLLTWGYNGTASVFPPPLAHAGFNTANSALVPLPMEAVNGDAYPTVLLTVTTAVWIVALLLVVATRGRLGHGAGLSSAG